MHTVAALGIVQLFLRVLYWDSQLCAVAIVSFRFETENKQINNC